MTKASQLAAGLAALGLAAAPAGCGSSDGYETTSTATPQAVASPSPTAASTSDASDRPDSDGNGIPDKITVKGKAGDTLALEGSGLNDDPEDHTKTRIRVTLKDVRGPFEGFNIPAGRELIGVDLRFENVGELRYDDAQPNGELAVAGGESGKQTSLIQVGGKNPCENPSLKLKTGQSKDACIAFEVPKSEEPRTFQYVSDVGFGDTALWSLR